MSDPTQPSSSALHVGLARSPATPAGKSAELPIVIHPRPLPLARIEELLHRDRSLARRLGDNPMHLHALATAVLRHDGAARACFRDAEQLVQHLQSRL